MPVIIPASGIEAVIRTLGYFLLGTAGLWVMFKPPVSIEGEIGKLTYLWGICLVTSFISAYGSLKRRYRVEFAALPLTLTGVLIYAYTIWVIVPGTITRGPQALIVTVVACMLLIRLLTLRRIVVSWKGQPWIGSLRSSRD